MSAGGLSYHMITSYGKATLPSVNNWGTNTNILKDPPKGIHTRRIDKVGQTSDITDYIDSSGDRACEYIRQYPLGVNPMVGVSFGNYGNNGGAGGRTSQCRGTSASLPYKIGDVFRPPILRQEDLLPLSRQPRLTTSQTANPCDIDFTKRIHCPRDDYRQIKQDVIHTSARPTAIYKYETPIKEPFEVKYVIQNPVKVSVNSGFKAMDITSREVQIPESHINNDKLSYGMGTQICFDGNYKNNEMNLDTDRYIQDTATISYTTPYSGNEQVTYIHDDIQLENKLPYYSARTNISDSTVNVRSIPEYIPELERKMPTGTMRTNITDLGETQTSSRERYLPARPKYGSFENRGFEPVQERTANLERSNFNSQKSEMSRKVFEQMMGRSNVFGKSMSDNYSSRY